jgi:AcrR family transcriptional regulator
VPRLTRKEQQAHTRSCLLESAVRVFTRRGLHRASIDEVAADAGYTKGAFYANFKSKEELFLAMLDQRFAERLEAMKATMASTDAPESQARRGGEEFARYVASDPEWQRLFLEFAAHAARDEDFRAELVARYRTLRAQMTELYRTRLRELGIEEPDRLEDVSMMTFAMANGFAMERLLEPDAVPDDLYATMMEVFFTGLMAMAQAPR